MDGSHVSIFCPTVCPKTCWNIATVRNTLQVISCYYCRVVVGAATTEPHKPPGIPIDAATDGNSKGLKFVVSIRVPHLIGSCSAIGSPEKSAPMTERYSFWIKESGCLHNMVSSGGQRMRLLQGLPHSPVAQQLS